MFNVPDVKLGIVAVSRDCFPVELSRTRMNKLADAVEAAGLSVIRGETVIESEADAVKAGQEMYEKGANAAIVFLGNFGPEGPTTIFIKRFHGPVMCCAAAEEDGQNLVDGRGDAFCGMLNLSYNLKLRGLRAHIPEQPVGLPEDLAEKVVHFNKVAKVWLGVKNLKVISYGPRPQDFYACNAPIQPLYDLGVEVMENSELDLLDAMKAAESNPDVDAIAADMAKELCTGNQYPEMLRKLACFESALLKSVEDNAGSRKYVVMANKCWPAFQCDFGFCPCFINARLSTKGMPVACEVDMYGAVSEYMCQLATDMPATILDINNTVPPNMITSDNLEGFDPSDLFMGFHCGNTPSCHLREGFAMKYQLIMHRLLEGDVAPNVSRGTLEGYLKPGNVTVFRLQSTSDCQLRGYVADGKVLEMEPNTFGSTGVIGVKGLQRFYRHVLIGQNFPHHAAVAFNNCGGVLFDAYKLLTGKTPAFPLPPTMLYPEENPFTSNR